LTHPEAATITREALIERARDLAPDLRQRAAATEAARRLLPETVQAFTDAGFWRIVQPKRFGGFELGIDVLEEVVVEVGRGCGSSAWCLAILGGHTWWTALFNESGQREIFGDEGHVIMATNLSGNGRARLVEGGYELSGRFVYLSGCDVANWLCVGAMVETVQGTGDGGQATYPPGSGPSAGSGRAGEGYWIYAAIRPQDARIVDDWYVLGLRGTGSKTVLVDKLFVPEHLTMRQADVANQEQPGRYLHTNPMYAAPMLGFLSIETTGAAVGIALQAVDVLDETGRSKPANALRSTAPQMTSETPVFRRHLGEARSLAEAAGKLLQADSRRLMDTVADYAPKGQKFTQEEILEYTLGAARPTDLCVQAVEHAVAAAGTSAMAEGHPLERCFRDIMMLSTHNVYRMDQVAERWSLAHYGLQA
jgi:3-hydroxy-9,10-secoandrosta-1,3,5(10)-triene-9,17-dione monooxygenase